MKFLNFISPLLFEHLKKRGMLVFYWVLNDEEDYQRAIQVKNIQKLAIIKLKIKSQE